jgi:hypothetical protein
MVADASGHRLGKAYTSSDELKFEKCDFAVALIAPAS